MPPIDDHAPHYWRSLDELERSDAFRTLVEREHHGQSWESLPPGTRRQFLKLMGASVALAGLSGCRWPKETIVPFARPAGYTPGLSQQYATAIEIGGTATGLLVTSYDGRPIKVEGNPSHPMSLGATDSIAQASVLEVYDPSRSRTAVRRDGGQRLPQTWDDFAAFAGGHFAALRSSKGSGLAVLHEASSSPSLERMWARFHEVFPAAARFEYEPVSQENAREGAAIAFGAPYRTRLALDQADVIVCLDADPLLTHPAAVRYARDFAKGRRPEVNGMSRLYAVEGVLSVTGAAADERIIVPTSEIPGVAVSLAAELQRRGADGLAQLSATRGGDTPAGGAIARMAEDLIAHKGRALVIAGPRQPAAVHALVHAMNAALAAPGATVLYTKERDADRPAHTQAIAALAGRLQGGAVQTLVIIGGNPVFDAPVDVNFAAALPQAAVSIHLSQFENETSLACRWHLPRAHYLESWGDARAYDGTVSVVQPLIEPLYGGGTPLELLSLIVETPPRKGYEIVRETMSAMIPAAPDFESAWRKLLEAGVAEGTADLVETPEIRPAEIASRIAGLQAPAQAEALELVFIQDSKVHDGRFANNAWLQELPAPLTKITWDNAALLAPETAKSLGVKADDVVAVNAGGREIELPVYVMPGQAPRTVAIALGYGRKAAGEVGDGIGANAYALRSSAALHLAQDVRVRPTGRRRPLACTQDHHAMDAIGRRGIEERLPEIVREIDLARYYKDPHALLREGHAEKAPQLWKEHSYAQGHQWGMAIDLNACIGCGACMVACQAENNVPVVGPDQIRRGRDMHWIRVDRYFKGDPANPKVAHQPVACVQCENAPCEQVCPVAATAHSSEGINEQVYNRCVGTRYCANNCPYKVRRFNWFNFHKNLTQIEKMVHNPEVTVRSRGVMEKCTYCIQRIEGVKIKALAAGRPIEDGEITPACAQACPTQAIVFGDLNDPESRVRKLHENPRAYGLLEELNTRPRTQYLTKITNPAHGAAETPAAERSAPAEGGAPAHEG